jgi:hypothetical protein
MYPDMIDSSSNVASGAGGAVAHQSRKKKGPSAKALMELKRFNEAFHLKYVPEIKLKEAEITKALFAKMANGDLLT